MLHDINSKNLIDMESEIHYSFRNFIPKKEYPQRHDFYEFFLVNSGSFTLIAEGLSRTVKQNDFCMLTPGTIHSKYEIPMLKSSHTNMAFLSSTMDDLCKYLYGKSPDEVLPHGAVVLSLNKNEGSFLRSKMEYINLLPDSSQDKKRTYLRQLLVYIVFEILNPHDDQKQNSLIVPHWMQEIIQCLDHIDLLREGLPWIAKTTGLSKEYICRSFKRYLNLSPTQYLNMKRLNYVSNMLVHSDRSIQELCYDIGISSISYFYRIFTKAFGVPPSEYRKKRTNPKIAKTEFRTIDS